jgi:TIR domain
MPSPGTQPTLRVGLVAGVELRGVAEAGRAPRSRVSGFVLVWARKLVGLRATVIPFSGTVRQMAGNIFINYRREESGHAAGRLREWLRQAFGPDKLFMDVDNIPAGFDFADLITKQVAACDAMLAVIGPN